MAISIKFSEFVRTTAAAQFEAVQVAAQPGLLPGFCCFDESEVRSNKGVLNAIIEAPAPAQDP